VLYFWKDSEQNQNGPIDENNISSTVFWGTFAGNPESSLISLIKNLFLPDVRANKSWPITLKKDLTATLERFMTNMNDVSCSVSGKTILYIPQDDLENIKDCAADKELVQRLESSVIHWTRQIKATLNSQELTGRGQESVEDASPLAELAFWSSRSADLSGIEHQLKDLNLVRIVEVLQHAKSSYLQNFLTLAEHIEAKTLEARDNHKVLKPLEDPCTRLIKASLAQIPPLLEEIICIVRAIWTWSEHFTSSENVPGLLRKVSNTVIARCRASISISEVMGGDIAKSVGHLSSSLHVMETWRNLYLTHARLIGISAARYASKASAEPAAAAEGGEATDAVVESETSVRQPNLKSWDSAFESRIFAQMDAFMQRCRNLLELCEWRAQFTYKLACDLAEGAPEQASAKEEEEQEEEDEEGNKKKKENIVELLPAFGGTQAQEIYSSLKAVRESFHKYMQNLVRVKYDPLDVRAPEWHDDFSLFKTEVRLVNQC
jgi:dynein heavy chain, axonemal